MPFIHREDDRVLFMKNSSGSFFTIPTIRLPQKIKNEHELQEHMDIVNSLLKPMNTRLTDFSYTYTLLARGISKDTKEVIQVFVLKAELEQTVKTTPKSTYGWIPLGVDLLENTNIRTLDRDFIALYMNKQITPFTL